MGKVTRITDEQIQKIIEMYLDDYSKVDIAKHLGISTQSVTKYLLKNNIQQKEYFISEETKDLICDLYINEKMGIKKISDALTLAGYAGLDLVLMNQGNGVAVTKIMDYNKFRYEKQKKLKDAQKKQRETSKEIKEYRLSVTIDVGDFETRRRNAENYLKKGHKIKAFIRFKGRQMAHTELGIDVLNRFAEALSEVSTVEQKPQLDGRQAYMLLAPKK